jgi:peptidoglycan DL-endopeptidase CwlO
LVFCFILKFWVTEFYISRIKFWHAIAIKFYKKIAFLAQYYAKKIHWRFKRRLPELKKTHINTFPAMHLKALDRVDLLLKFSGELTIILLVFAVSAFNLAFFWNTKAGEYSDQSHAAKLLSYHPSLNPQLYTKNISVITTISKEAGFITEARAEESYDTLNTTTGYLPESPEEAPAINNENVLSQSPDGISELIAKQIKVYETKPGDTLKSIAETNNLSQQTLIWANNLPNSQIKPCWFLKIPPTDGIIYKATTNDTLPDLAKKYKADLDTIIAYNGLENAEDIDGGKILIIPGGSMPELSKPKLIAKNNSGKTKPVGIMQPKVVDNGTGHIFPWGYCTWYVATRLHVPWGGNAKNWLANARSYGAVITNTPTPGAIVVTTDNRRYGHVAIVENVSDDGFTVSEMNYQKFGRVNNRFIPLGSKIIRGFILP